MRTRPNWEAGSWRLSRLTTAFRRICFAAAAGLTFAVVIGATGRIVKIRGCRRGWCSADEASFGAGAGTSARHRAAGCLLIDQHMPGTSGLDVVDNLRRRGIQIPTILISGGLDASIRERATRLGVRELLDKPVPAGRLIQAIRAIL